MSASPSFVVDQSRLSQIAVLDNGGHTPDEGAMCAMEGR